jgi:hypothetical protein
VARGDGGSQEPALTEDYMGSGRPTERGMPAAQGFLTSVRGLREALDLTDTLGGGHDTALRLFALGPMATVVALALDESNPDRSAPQRKTSTPC